MKTLALLSLLVSSCSSNYWIGGEENKKVIAGERKEILLSEYNIQRNTKFTDLSSIKFDSINKFEASNLKAYALPSSATNKSQVIYSNDILYYVSDNGKSLHAYNMLDSKEIWKSDFLEHRKLKITNITISNINNILFAASNTGFIYAYNLNDGVKLWDTKIDYPINNMVANDTYNLLCASNINFNTNCVDYKGNRVVNFEDYSSDITVKNGFAPIVTDAILYYANKNGNIRSFSFNNGMELWKTDVSSNLDIGGSSFYNIVVKPIADSENIYLANYAGGIFKISRHDGKILWNSPMKGTKILKKYENYLIAITRSTDLEDSLYIIDAENGTVSYSNNLHKINKSIDSVIDVVPYDNSINIFAKNFFKYNLKF